MDKNTIFYDFYVLKLNSARYLNHEEESNCRAENLLQNSLTLNLLFSAPIAIPEFEKLKTQFVRKCAKKYVQFFEFDCSNRSEKCQFGRNSSL